MNHDRSVSRLLPWFRGDVGLLFLVLAPLLGATMARAEDPASSSAEPARAWLRVAMTEPNLVFSGAGFNAAEFKIFKRTQMRLIKCRSVLTAALRKPEVRQLKLEEHHKDPVGWLAQQIKVESPDDTEIVEVSSTNKDPEQAVILANAVVDAYLSQVVDVDRNRKRQRLNELDRAYADAEGKLRTRRYEVKQLAEQLGVSDNKSLSLKQQIGLQDFGMYQQHLTRTQIELRQAKAALDAQKMMLANLSDQEIPAFEVDNYVRNDPQARQLAEQLAMQRMAHKYTEANASESKKNGRRDLGRTDMKVIQQQYDELLKSMREGIRNMKRSEIEKERMKKELEVEALTDQVQEFSKAVEKKKGEAEKLSVSSIDLEMMQSEIEQLAKTVNAVADEREKLNVEIRTPPRVTLLQKAGISQGKE